jgi:hypothetical protein
MKKLLPIVIVFLIAMACAPIGQPTAPAGPGVETIVAMTLEALTKAAPPVTEAPEVPTGLPPTQPNGTVVSYENVSFVLPQGLASNALSGTVPAVPPTQDGPGWDVAPEYVKFELDGYPLYDTFHRPQILVYPAQEYAAVNEAASRNITRLQALLNGSAALTADNLPTIPFFNAGQVFAAQIKTVQFQNGSGVRFLTEYAQSYNTANNRDLFYQFQGLTSDGKYYIIAILPASHPLLAFDENPETVVPAGGIPFPGFDDQNALNAYYPAVVNLLNSSAPESFNPALPMLDALIQSIAIAP